MAETTDRMRSRRLWWLTVVSAVGLVVAYAALVRTASGQRLDGAALEHRFAVTRGSARGMERLLDAISARSVSVCSAALVLVALLRRRAVLAAGVVVALGGAAVAARGLKDHVLTRPELGGFGGVSYNTFPSGHATVGIALALALVMVTPARWAWASSGVAAIAGPIVGVAVLTTGEHRPSDSLGAYLATLAWFGACAAAVAWLDRPTPAVLVSRATPRWWTLLAGVAACLVLAGLLAGSIDGPERRAGLGAGPYVLGVIGIDAVGVGAVLVFAAAQHDLVGRVRSAATDRLAATRPA